MFLFAWKFGDRDQGSACFSVFLFVVAAAIDVIALIVWAIFKIFRLH